MNDPRITQLEAAVRNLQLDLKKTNAELDKLRREVVRLKSA